MKNISGSAVLKCIRHQLCSGWRGIKFCVKSALSQVAVRAARGRMQKGGRGGAERDNTSTYQHNLSNCARSHGLMVSGIAVGVIRQQLVVVPSPIAR